MWSQGRPSSWAALPRRQQSQHNFLDLVSQVLMSKESQAPWPLAMLIPLVHILSFSTVSQHCSCTVLHVVDEEIRGTFAHSSLSLPYFCPCLQHSSIEICSAPWPRRTPNREQSSTTHRPIERGETQLQTGEKQTSERGGLPDAGCSAGCGNKKIITTKNKKKRKKRRKRSKTASGGKKWM